MAEDRQYEKESSKYFKDVELDASQIKWGIIPVYHLPEDVVLSQPPATFHKVYGIYARKVDDVYSIILIVDSEAEI